MGNEAPDVRTNRKEENAETKTFQQAIRQLNFNDRIEELDRPVCTCSWGAEGCQYVPQPPHCRERIATALQPMIPQGKFNPKTGRYEFPTPQPVEKPPEYEIGEEERVEVTIYRDGHLSIALWGNGRNGPFRSIWNDSLTDEERSGIRTLVLRAIERMINNRK